MAGRYADAMHTNYVTALQQITVLGSGGRAELAPPWVLLDAGLDFDFFNIATVRGAVEDPAAAVAHAAEWFDSHEKPFRFILRDAADAALVAAAEVCGFRVDPHEREPAMLLRPLAALPAAPPGLRIVRVTTAADAAAYATVEPAMSGDRDLRLSISERALTTPGCALFVGWVGGVAVARSMSLVTGEMAGVYNVFVAPELRGRGYGTAMTAAAIAAGQASGATAACLSATELGLPVYEAMGFRTQFRYLSLWRDRR
ncbi:MAG: GNAT family N-acetyltransferase [Dehalococcoidia bacterium]